MMITVWFAADVLEKFRDRTATMRTCENCIAQYVQVECKKHGEVVGSPRLYDQLCEIVGEAIAEGDPHLRGLIDLTYKILEPGKVAVEVRMSSRFRFYHTDSNPGLLRLH
jgi:hypothetical protein